VEHFELLLNHDNTTAVNSFLDATDPPMQGQYNANCCRPSEAEIEDVIKRLQNNKAPCEDDLPTEIFKSCSTDISQ
jgi:hypothetical protein